MNNVYKFLDINAKPDPNLKKKIGFSNGDVDLFIQVKMFRFFGIQIFGFVIYLEEDL